MRNVDEIMERVAYKKAELKFNGIESKYLFLDRGTYDVLKFEALKVMDESYVEQCISKYLSALGITKQEYIEFIVSKINLEK